MPMGTIISAAAVLLIHSEMNAVATMNPSTMRRGLAPTPETIPSASRRCRFHSSMAAAIHMPPRNRKFTGSKYCWSTRGKLPAPMIGNTSSGSSAVAHRGSGSVIHQHAIQNTVPAVNATGAGCPSACSARPTATKPSGPSASPTRLPIGMRDSAWATTRAATDIRRHLRRCASRVAGSR